MILHAGHSTFIKNTCFFHGLICPLGHGEDKMKTLKIVCVMLLLHVSLLGKAL